MCHGMNDGRLDIQSTNKSCKRFIVDLLKSSTSSSSLKILVTHKLCSFLWLRHEISFHPPLIRLPNVYGIWYEMITKNVVFTGAKETNYILFSIKT